MRVLDAACVLLILALAALIQVLKVVNSAGSARDGINVVLAAGRHLAELKKASGKNRDRRARSNVLKSAAAKAMLLRSSGILIRHPSRE